MDNGNRGDKLDTRQDAEEKEETLLGKKLAPVLWEVTNRDSFAPRPHESSGSGSRTSHKDYQFDPVNASVSMTQRNYPLSMKQHPGAELDPRQSKILNSQHEFESRQLLTDEDILRLIPRQPGGSSENVVRLKECTWRECLSVAPTGCQGYCVKHFCHLYRENVLDIEPKPYKDSEPIGLNHEGGYDTSKGPMQWQWTTMVTTPGNGYDQSPMRMRHEVLPVFDDDYAVEKPPVRKPRSKPRSKSRSKHDVTEVSHHRKPFVESKTYESPKSHSHRDSKLRQQQDKTKRIDVIESGYSSSDTEPTPRTAKPKTTKTTPQRCPGPMCYAKTTSGLCDQCESMLDRYFESERRSEKVQRLSKKPCPGPDCHNYGSSDMNGLCRECHKILSKARSRDVPMPRPEY